MGEPRTCAMRTASADSAWDGISWAAVTGGSATQAVAEPASQNSSRPS